MKDENKVFQKVAVFWIKDIKNMDKVQIEKYSQYEKLFNEKGYKVEPREIKDFHGSIFPNSVRHIGGYGTPEIVDFIEHLENNNGNAILNI